MLMARQGENIGTSMVMVVVVVVAAIKVITAVIFALMTTFIVIAMVSETATDYSLTSQSIVSPASGRFSCLFVA